MSLVARGVLSLDDTVVTTDAGSRQRVIARPHDPVSPRSSSPTSRARTSPSLPARATRTRTMLLSIRPERAGDAAAIRAVHAAAFPTTVEAGLVDALREARRLAVSLVAEEAGAVIGHVALSHVSSSDASDARRGLGLAPIAVLPARQRTGIGGRLVRAGLAASAEAGFDFVVVLGDPRYYHRFGFQRASQHGLGNEYGAGAEFQVMALRDGGLPAAGCVVRYAPEFAIIGA